MIGTEDEWPNDHDWTCDCDECRPLWEALAEEENAEIPLGKEPDEELEHELDQIYEKDGW